MTTSAGDKAALQFYPERYYSASPTYNTWVKLTAAAVHALRPAPISADAAISRTDNFDPVHPTFFLLNHPIRFVRLIGTVVAVEDLGPRFVLITLDDGSGATLELKLTRLLLPADNSTTTTTTTSSPSSNTNVANVVVRSAIGVFEVLVDGARIDVGTTLKAKCTLGTFRGVVQGLLQRCWVLGSGGGAAATRAEADGWRDTAAFMRGVLARPWMLGADDVARLERRLAKDEKQRRDEERRAERKRAERGRRRGDRGERLRVYEEKVERRRRQEEVLMNKGALV